MFWLYPNFRFHPAGLVRKLCGLANNLYKDARKANAQGYRNARSEYLQLADRIVSMMMAKIAKRQGSKRVVNCILDKTNGT